MDLYLSMPVSEYYGWGICGKNLLKEFAKKVNIGWVSENFENAFRDDETDRFCKKYEVKLNGDVQEPIIHYVDNDGFRSFCSARGGKNIGYAFFEEEDIPSGFLDNAKRNFDILVGGSEWNGKLFREHGLVSEAIPQGVDRGIFKPGVGQHSGDGSFVVFSGGKWEQRKGQDIVIKAVAEAQRKYPKIKLIGAWFNIFDSDWVKKSVECLKSSGLKNLEPLGAMSQEELASVMQKTDIGIFPNRVEGGTNLVLMEYLGCGKPAIARDYRGQSDVLNGNYAFLTCGDDAHCLQQTIEHLLYAYEYRDKLKEMGKKADEAMNNFTWEKTAEKFLNLTGIN